MANRQFKILVFLKTHWQIFLVGFVYLFLTLPALLDNNHFLYNLEPYPDGMLYALSGRNAVLGREFGLISAYSSIDHWVPPMYSWVLGAGYLLFGTTLGSFYFTNVLLQLTGLIFLYLILHKTTKHWFTTFLGLIIYLSHLVLIWLPTLPMGENLIVPLFLILIFSLFEKRQWLKYSLLFFSLGGLFFTRYTTIGTVIAGLLILSIQLYPKLNKGWRLIIFSTIPMAVIAFELLLRFRGIRIWGIIRSIVNGNNLNFSLKFLLPNLMTYMQMLFWGKGWYLWLPIGISTAILTGLFLFAIYYFFRTKKFTKANLLLFFFLAQLPVQLFFYVADARYLILTIPLIALGTSWLVDQEFSKRQWLFWFVVGGIFIQLFTQKTLLKEIIGNNLLGRSTAWQYESIQHFNQVLTKNDLLITALPPFLIDTYQNRDYRPLPLSQTQEFMQKKQYVWGEDIDYEELKLTYQTWLKAGRAIYISNAYITHQQSVINDYENYKEDFSFELISEGCEQACNIYRLTIH
ncbi:MAG: hypothetical protein A2182_00040 [Candidatus Pacebacteria bacterium RIFOXYA1_FULL_38_18]|nr:MAG: hypothetical protein A2182_00040 [Candidatus Pacebacteria bacterium RIFOXYA1_FULL_38_18]OGJ39453.1 MAG: hypothetical protein A2411_01695 [Candidatus Pacebacteria bacterium RIFOXYC1_FULL_39_21]